MKVALHVIKARRERLAELLSERQYMPLGELCERLNISEATARRDLAALAEDQVLTRTWGGALGGALRDYNERFRSFGERQAQAADAKRAIATAAVGLVSAGQTCFLDAGTTVLAVAEALLARGPRPLTVVTNNLPVAEILSAAGGDLTVNLIGGQYFARQRLVLGRQAVRGLRLWKFDAAFLGAEGMDAAGLWNSHADVVALQRQVAATTPQVGFCVDAGKCGRQAPAFLLPWGEVKHLVSDAGVATLASHGIVLGEGQLVAAHAE
jgi:DeoR/GlpR family transcriptional regulator of sugar metabolism